MRNSLLIVGCVTLVASACGGGTSDCDSDRNSHGDPWTRQQAATPPLPPHFDTRLSSSTPWRERGGRSPWRRPRHPKLL